MKLAVMVLLSLSLLLAGCARVGSDRWCEKMSDQPKGDWTANELGDYARYCMLGLDSENACKGLEEKSKGDWTANEAGYYAKNCLLDRTSEDSD